MDKNDLGLRSHYFAYFVHLSTLFYSLLPFKSNHNACISLLLVYGEEKLPLMLMRKQKDIV